MANYNSPEKVLQVIRASDEIERVRGLNRAQVLKAANCVPPLDATTAKELGIKINCSFGELLIQVTRAAGQMMTAFFGNNNFFNVKLPLAPVDKKSDWESFITAEINRPLRESVEWFVLHLNRWKSLTLHGCAPMMWSTDDKWLPDFVSLAELIIPTDTTIDYRNLNEFTRLRNYTVFELADEALLRNKPGWDKEQVLAILRNYKELNTTNAVNNYNIQTDIERITELMHQNGGFYGSDALPTIPLYHFYFLDKDKDGRKGWYMRVVPQAGVLRGGSAESNTKFLWTSDKPVAYTWKELLHCQYGDLSADTPAKHSSVRGLGFILLEPTFYMNLTRCRMLQHLNDQFNVWMRNRDTADKARKQMQEFGNYCVVGEGLSIIPQTERHQVDGALIEMAFGQLKQLQGEASASYTQQADTGTQKEQTAFETRVKMEQVNALMGAILTMAFQFEKGADREICRRFCKKDSTDPDINKFQRRCKQYGIPPEWLDVENWEVDPVRPMGDGNATIAQASAQQLMALRGMMIPESQNKVLHQAVSVITDPRTANDLVPLDGQPQQSDAFREAQGLFGTLMSGVMVQLWPKNVIDQYEAIIPLFSGKIVQISNRDSMASLDEAMGLNAVGGADQQPLPSYLDRAILKLSQDPQMAERVQSYRVSLGKLQNELKALIQHGVQAREKQQQNGIDQQNNQVAAETQAKLQATQTLSTAKANDKTAQVAQGLHHAEMKFTAEEHRKNEAAAAEQKRKDAAAFNQIEIDKEKARSQPKESKPSN